MHGETGRGNGTNDEHMVHNFPTACINWNERTSSNCSPKFPTEIHGKLLFRCLSNLNLRDFWLNGERLGSSVKLTKPFKPSCSQSPSFI